MLVAEGEQLEDGTKELERAVLWTSLRIRRIRVPIFGPRLLTVYKHDPSSLTQQIEGGTGYNSRKDSLCGFKPWCPSI